MSTGRKAMRNAVVCTLTLTLVALFSCAATTTFGAKPKPLPLRDNAYSFKIYYNMYTTKYDLDQKANELISNFMNENGFVCHRITNVQDYGIGTKIIYEVEFSNKPFPSNDLPILPSQTPPPQVNTEPPSIATGTGFVFASGGYLLTCSHVVAGAQRVSARTIDGRIHETKEVIRDDESDWCVLLAPTIAVKPIALAPQKSILVGMPIYSIAYPLAPILNSISPVVGAGNVAAVQGLNGDPKHMQITVPINPGSSGSPVLDEYGNWIGIASHRLNDMYSLSATGSIPQGVNFCVKATLVSELIRSTNGLQIPQGVCEEKLSLSGTVAELSPSIVLIISEIPSK